MQEDLLRELQETGMFEFAQNLGVLSDLMPMSGAPHWAGGIPDAHDGAVPSDGEEGLAQDATGAAGSEPLPDHLQLHLPQQLQTQLQVHDEEQRRQRQQELQQSGSQPGLHPQQQQHQQQHQQPEHQLQQQPPPAPSLPPPLAGSAPPPDPALQAVRQATNDAAEGAVSHALDVLLSAREALGGVGRDASLSPQSDDVDYEGGASGSRRRRSSTRGTADQGLYGHTGAGSSKSNKGLRHFSMKVCEKVESKGTTTYNEVADELVAEMKDAAEEDGGQQYDEKNIRRRVYDAINVLMALDIIAKEKKAIMWKGFPTARPGAPYGVVSRLAAERSALASDVERRATFLKELVEQQRALSRLLAANAGRPPARGTALALPFILVQARPDATVEVQISEDMRDVQFDFYNSPFQIHDDSYVLRVMTEEEGKGVGADERRTNGANGSAFEAKQEPDTPTLAAAHMLQQMPFAVGNDANE